MPDNLVNQALVAQQQRQLSNDMRVTTIGERVRESRKKHGLNQMELARRLGVTQPTVANWETGIHDPRQVMLAKIADTLAVDFAWLTSGARSQTEKDKHAAAAYLRRGLYHVPVLNLQDAQHFHTTPHQDPHALAVDYIPFTFGNETLLAVFIEDEAMNLAFFGKTLVVVDYHNRTPQDGDLALVVIKDSKPFIRRWRTGPARLEPYSNDPNYDTTYLDTSHGIIGIVAASIKVY